MSTHNIDFYEDLTKIIFELSSNTHLISSADHSSVNNEILSQPITLLAQFNNTCTLTLNKTLTTNVTVTKQQTYDKPCN